MKRYLIIIATLIVLGYAYDILYYYTGTLYFPHIGEPSYFSKAEGDRLYINEGDGFEIYDIRGVNLGLGKPGYYATEYSITKEEYLSWFRQIKDLGANTIRTYTLAHPDFYEAFYEFNAGNPDPLYLIHGVWVDDYLINATYSALDEEFSKPFLDACKDTVDVIHGRHKTTAFGNMLPDRYKYDISPWVYGYILGIEWESTLVHYTDEYKLQLPQHNGTYFYTEDAGNFEIFLAQAGEAVAQYETGKYGTQRVIAFSNWATTDPLTYPENITEYFEKSGSVDTERIKCTDAFNPGQFASYHVYPYYPDYCAYMETPAQNTYRQYLRLLNSHHSMPVVISEFGVSTSRGVASIEDSLGRNQGFMSEQQQGEALISMYEDIKAAGSAGAIVFTWQDEWFKRSWNTMSGIDLEATPYWSDYQTNEQCFGLLSFDPGEEESICYVDGSRQDWSDRDLIGAEGGYRLSVKYDEKFLYFLVESETDDILASPLYLPIDTTPKSGSTICYTPFLRMSEAADFIIALDGKEDSRVLVHTRYDPITALYYNRITPETIFSQEFPDTNDPHFSPIYMLVEQERFFAAQSIETIGSDSDIPIPFSEFTDANPLHYSVLSLHETGKLTYGNANPAAEEFNSLADFCAGDGFVEIKLPWQLLNFADPSSMKIHDDYYEHFGVEYLRIDTMRVGAGSGRHQMYMYPVTLEKLGKSPSYHERLKASYYILQDYWTTH